jgi:hypothetical protein
MQPASQLQLLPSSETPPPGSLDVLRVQLTVKMRERDSVWDHVNSCLDPCLLDDRHVWRVRSSHSLTCLHLLLEALMQMEVTVTERI